MTHVLVTRPLKASQQLAARLDDLGLNPLVMPFYTFTERDPGFDISAHWSKKGRNLAVFTSPRAVEFGLAYIQPESVPTLELAVVGSATRRELQTSGHKVHLQAKSGYTSEDLLKLSDLQDQPGNVVIFCAPGGRETLADGLAGFGWSVANAFVYERVALSPSQAQLDELAEVRKLISVWTSVSAIDLASQELPGSLWTKILKSPALVISKRIQVHLEQMGAKNCDLTDGPGNQEVFEAIVSLMEGAGSG